MPGCPWRPWLGDSPNGSVRYGHESRDDRGRVRVNLGVHHRFANSGGWQWRYRLVVAYALGHLPRPDEHVDHENEVIDDDRLENLSLVGVVYHGQIHAEAWELAGRRGPDGRWRTLSEPARVPRHRLGPVLSSRPLDPRTWTPRARVLNDKGGP